MLISVYRAYEHHTTKLNAFTSIISVLVSFSKAHYFEDFSDISIQLFDVYTNFRINGYGCPPHKGHSLNFLRTHQQEWEWNRGITQHLFMDWRHGSSITISSPSPMGFSAVFPKVLFHILGGGFALSNRCMSVWPQGHWTYACTVINCPSARDSFWFASCGWMKKQALLPRRSLTLQ